MMQKLWPSAAAALLITCTAMPAASAQSTTPPPPQPCQSDEYRAFDFWLGDWSVTSGGKAAGENLITSQEGGCLILEQWTSAGGTTGQSYNFYDPGLGEWRQLWVSGGSVIDYTGGLDENGAMVLEGVISYRNGNTAPFKGTWTLQDDGTVRQHFLQYNAQTDVWDDWFVGIYTKKETSD